MIYIRKYLPKEDMVFIEARIIAAKNVRDCAKEGWQTALNR